MNDLIFALVCYQKKTNRFSYVQNNTMNDLQNHHNQEGSVGFAHES